MKCQFHHTTLLVATLTLIQPSILSINLSIFPEKVLILYAHNIVMYSIVQCLISEVFIIIINPCLQWIYFDNVFFNFVGKILSSSIVQVRTVCICFIVKLSSSGLMPFIHCSVDGRRRRSFVIPPCIIYLSWRSLKVEYNTFLYYIIVLVK